MEFLMTYFIQPILIFAAGYIYLRLAGKKAIAEMSSFDMLLIIVMGTLLAQPLSRKSTTETIGIVFIWLVIYLLFSKLTLHNRFKWLLVARPTVLIRNGDIDEKGLRKAKMNTSELLGAIRSKGMVNTADVELAVMEDIGKISVIPKSHARPLQPKDIQLQPSPTFIPIPIIIDGQILQHNLHYLKKDDEWLKMQLMTHNLRKDEIDRISLATCTQQGHLAVDFHHKEKPQGPSFYEPGLDP